MAVHATNRMKNLKGVSDTTPPTLEAISHRPIAAVLREVRRLQFPQ